MLFFEVSYSMGTGGSCPGFQRSKREADQSPPSKTEVKIKWINTSTPHNPELVVHKQLRLITQKQTMHTLNFLHINSKAHITVTVNIHVFTHFFLDFSLQQTLHAYR
jgi:hypothetical protein